MLRKQSIFIILLTILSLSLIGLKNYAYYWDGVEYAWQIEFSPSLNFFHRHHLLYSPFCRLISLLTTKSGISLRAIDLLILINIIFGAFFLVNCFRIFNKIFPNRYFVTFTGVIIIAFSYTFGTYWRNADPYIIPLSILSFMFFISFSNDNDAITFRVKSLHWILLLIATLFHQFSLFCLPALVFAHIQSLKRRRFIFLHLVLFFLIIAIVHIIIFFLTYPSPSLNSFLNWAYGYANQGRFWVSHDKSGVLQSIYHSFNESLASNKALFFAPAGIERDTLRIYDLRFVRHDSSFMLFFGWLVFIIMLFLLVKGIISLIKDKKRQKLALFLIIWILPYIIILQFFTPYQSFYRLFYILPIAIFILSAITMYFRFITKIFMILFIISYLMFNFIYGFIPESNKRNNPYLLFSKYVENNSTPRDLFIFPIFPDYHYGVYLRYFGNRNVSFIKRLSMENENGISKKRINDVCNESSIWINENYDRIYIAEKAELVKNNLIKLTIPLINNSSPELIVINTSQLSYISENALGYKIFYLIKLKKIEE